MSDLEQNVPKRIYLDTKDWIYLAQVRNGLKKDLELVEVYEKIKNLSESGDAIFPISFFHLTDIMMRQDDDSRNRLIDFIVLISKGYVLQPYTFYISSEVVNASYHRLNFLSRHDIKSLILGKGLSYFVSRGYEISLNKDAVDNPEKLIQKLKEESDKPESMAKFLKEGTTAEKFQKDRIIFDKAAKRMDEFRKEKMKMEKHERFKHSIAYFLYEIISPPLTKFLSARTSELKNKIIPKDAESMEKFLEDMPATNVSFRLTYGRDAWYEREVQPNDIADIGHLAGAIPYCDIVVTEKAFGSLCKQQGLDKKYDCTVVNSLKELNKII